MKKKNNSVDILIEEMIKKHEKNLNQMFEEKDEEKKSI